MVVGIRHLRSRPALKPIDKNVELHPSQKKTKYANMIYLIYARVFSMQRIDLSMLRNATQTKKQAFIAPLHLQILVLSPYETDKEERLVLDLHCLLVWTYKEALETPIKQYYRKEDRIPYRLYSESKIPIHNKKH